MYIKIWNTGDKENEKEEEVRREKEIAVTTNKDYEIMSLMGLDCGLVQLHLPIPRGMWKMISKIKFKEVFFKCFVRF